MERNEEELRQLVIDMIVFMDFEQLIKASKSLGITDGNGGCTHPLIDEVWSAIPGEPHLRQPDHIECLVCGKWV